METRPITKNEIESLSPYLKSHKEGLWGTLHDVTATLVHTVFGDGAQLISLEPTNSRPWYYILLAPSSIKSFEDALEFISNNEELIFQPIEEIYGNVDDEELDENGDRIKEDIDIDGEMPLNIGSGYTCGFFDDYKKSKP